MSYYFDDMPRSSTWDKIANKIDRNFRITWEQLCKLQNAVSRFCGLFGSLAELEAAVTDPEAGEYAYVNDFVYNASTWPSGVTYDPSHTYFNMYSWVVDDTTGTGSWQVTGVTDGSVTTGTGSGGGISDFHDLDEWMVMVATVTGCASVEKFEEEYGKADNADEYFMTVGAIIQYVKEKMSDADGRYLRKDQDDTTEHTLTMADAVVEDDATVKGEVITDDVRGRTAVTRDGEKEYVVDVNNVLRVKKRAEVDDIMPYTEDGDVTVNASVDFENGGGVTRKGFLADIINGDKWQIDEDGNAEMESLILRSFLEVPELRYNRVTVESGTTWNAPGAGVIKEVGKDAAARTLGADTYIDLKLERGEVGSFVEGDICMGIWHFRDEVIDDVNNPITYDSDGNVTGGGENYSDDNADDDAESDDTSGLTVSGFCRVEFEVLSVTDYEADETTIGSDGKTQITTPVTYSNGRVYIKYKPDHNGAVQPQMTIVAYGNKATDTDGSQKYPARTRSWYATKKFQRYIYNMDGGTKCSYFDKYGAKVLYDDLSSTEQAKCTRGTDGYAIISYKSDIWEISFPWNVAMHLGDSTGMKITEKDGTEVTMGDYSAFLSNVYFYGFLQKIDINQVDGVEAVLSTAYDLGLNAIVVHTNASGTVTSPSAGVTWNATKAVGSGTPTTLASADGLYLSVRFNTSAGAGTWVDSSTITGCTAYTGSLATTALGSYSSIDFMLTDKQASGGAIPTGYTAYKQSTVTYVKDGSNAAGYTADLSNEMSGVACDKDSHPSKGSTLVTAATFNYGGTALASKIAVSLTSGKSLSDYGITVTDSAETSGGTLGATAATSHELTFSVSKYDADTNKTTALPSPLEAVITLTYAGETTSTEGAAHAGQTADCTFTIMPVLPGADGEDSVIYELKPSVNSIKIDKVGTCSPTQITCSATRTEGSTTAELTYSQLASYGLYIFYAADTSTTWTRYTGAITVTSYTSRVRFRIQDNTTDTAETVASTTTVYDRESVPVLRDGADYRIGASYSSIRMNADGTYEASSSGLAAHVLSGSDILTAAQMQTNGLYLSVTLVNASNVEKYLNASGAVQTSETKFQTAFSLPDTDRDKLSPKRIVIYLYKSTTLLDAVTIPVVSDGDPLLTNLYGYGTYISKATFLHTNTGFAGYDTLGGTSTAYQVYLRKDALGSKWPAGTYSVSGKIKSSLALTKMVLGADELDATVGGKNTYTGIAANTETDFAWKFTTSDEDAPYWLFYGAASATIIEVYDLKIEESSGITGVCTPFSGLADDSIPQGPNMVVNSAFADASSWELLHGSAIQANLYQGQPGIYCDYNPVDANDNSGDSTTYGRFISQTLTLKPSTKYTFSWYCKGTGTFAGIIDTADEATSQFSVNDCKAPDVSTNQNLVRHMFAPASATEWEYHTMSFRTGASAGENCLVQFSAWDSASLEVYIALPKLEEGDKPTAWQLNEADRKGDDGVGQTGPILRSRGVFTNTLTYYYDNNWVDWCRTGKKKWRLGDTIYDLKYDATGKITYYRLATTDDDGKRVAVSDEYTAISGQLLVPSSSATGNITYGTSNLVLWQLFSEVGDISAGFIIADSIDATSTNTGEAFIGETSDGVTVDANGNLLVDGTANGWFINGGRISHTKTGLTLTKDGYLIDPNGLHFKVPEYINLIKHGNFNGNTAKLYTLNASTSIYRDASKGFDDYDDTTNLVFGSSQVYIVGGKQSESTVISAYIKADTNLSAMQGQPNIPLSVGSTYTLTTWILTSATAVNIGFSTCSSDSGIVPYSTYAATTAGVGENNWKAYTVTFVADKSYGFVSYAMNGRGTSTNVFMEIGAVLLTEGSAARNCWYPCNKDEFMDVEWKYMDSSYYTFGLNTGIDIYNQTITLTSDNLICKNNSGERTMWLDYLGNLTTTGVQANLVQEINVASGKNAELLILSTTEIDGSQISVSDNYSSSVTYYHLDALRCGDVIKITSVDHDIVVPFYVSSTNYVRTVTRFGNTDLHFITQAELVQLIGKRITVIVSDAGSATAHLYHGVQATGCDSGAVDMLNGNYNVTGITAANAGFQVSTPGIYIMEFSYGKYDSSLIYYWRAANIGYADTGWT